MCLNSEQNLLLSSNGDNSILKIADFGFARHDYFLLNLVFVVVIVILLVNYGEIVA